MKNGGKKLQLFLKNVSGKSHSVENLKEGTLWIFLKIHSVAKYQKK